MKSPLHLYLPLQLALLLIPSLVAASSSKVFYASAVSYCSEARGIEVQKFLLQYDASLKTIQFDISAATVNPDLNPILDFSLTAYGINAVNVSLNLCDELGGVLCPLPVYDFVGSATIPLPASITDDIKIPGIGFVIPDLEATAYVRLISVADGTEEACLKVDLSNGRTTRHTYVSWALGGIALLSIAVGFLGGMVDVWKGRNVQEGRRKERFVSLMTFFQFVATTGVLSLNYPLVFTSYAENFAWTLGLIYLEPLQVSMDATRLRTGGNLTQVAGNLVGGTEALSSKFVSNVALPRSNIPITTATELISALMPYFTLNTNSQFSRRAVSQAVAIPNVQETNTLDAVKEGIPRYLTSLGISPFNGFFTIFLNFLLLICIFLAISLIISLVYFLLAWRSIKRDTPPNPSRLEFLDILGANALRMLLISWFPLLIFTFFQWTIGKGDSWAPIVLSVFTIIFTTLALIFIAIRTLFLSRGSVSLSSSTLVEPRDGSSTPLWNEFKSSRWWFYFPILVGTVCRALFIAFAKNHGWVQTIGLLVIESLTFLLACIFTPYADKSRNGTNITIMILRIIISGALIVFNESIGLNEIIRVAIGIVIAVIESVVVVGYFLLVLIDLVAVIIHIFRRRQMEPSEKLEIPPMNGMVRHDSRTESMTLREPESTTAEKTYPSSPS